MSFGGSPSDNPFSSSQQNVIELEEEKGFCVFISGLAVTLRFIFSSFLSHFEPFDFRSWNENDFQRSADYKNGDKRVLRVETPFTTVTNLGPVMDRWLKCWWHLCALRSWFTAVTVRAAQQLNLNHRWNVELNYLIWSYYLMVLGCGFTTVIINLTIIS